MTAKQIKSVTSLPVADIVVEQRLRPVSNAGVEAIMASVTELGIIKDPIHVRKVPHRNNKLILMAGGHRLEAAKRLGWEEIPSTLWTCNDTWARLLEVDDNLASAELTPLDNALFLAERKRLYEQLHPETKAGVAGGLARQGLASDMMSFAGSTAEKFGISKRHVERMTAAGAKLAPDEAQRLRDAPRPVTLADLQQIAKINETVERYEVVDMLAKGTAKNAATARKKWKFRDRPQVEESPTDAEYLRVKAAFIRARKSARRRFAEDFYDDLVELITQIDEASDDYERENL